MLYARGKRLERSGPSWWALALPATDVPSVRPPARQVLCRAALCLETRTMARSLPLKALVEKRERSVPYERLFFQLACRSFSSTRAGPKIAITSPIKTMQALIDCQNLGRISCNPKPINQSLHKLMRHLFVCAAGKQEDPRLNAFGIFFDRMGPQEVLP